MSELIDVGQRGDPGQNGFPSADAELRQTVLTYIHERYSELRTAAWLFMHRDSLHGRLAQADELLPQPLDSTFTSRWHWRSSPSADGHMLCPPLSDNASPPPLLSLGGGQLEHRFHRVAGVAYVTLEPRSTPLK